MRATVRRMTSVVASGNDRTKIDGEGLHCERRHSPGNRSLGPEGGAAANASRAETIHACRGSRTQASGSGLPLAIEIDAGSGITCQIRAAVHFPARLPDTMALDA